MEEWEKKTDAKSEEESGSSASSDKESGTRKSEKGRGNYEECGGISYPSMIGTSSSYLPSQETFGETGMEREVSDKENGTGKQRRRTVTYDMGKMSPALLESTQDQQSDKGGRSSPCHGRKKKDKKILSQEGKSPHQQEEGYEDEEREGQEKEKVLECVIHTEY